MFLKTINLKNFRCYENIKVEFNDSVSVIVGSNGAGKTSILDGIAIALGTFFRGLDGISELSIRENDVRLESYKMGSSFDVQPQFPVEISASAIIEERTVFWKRALNSKTGSTLIKDAKELVGVSEETQKRLRNGDESLSLPLLAYYGTGRLWDYSRVKSTDSFETNTRTNGYIGCLGGNANVNSMMKWIKKKTIQQYQNKSQKKDFFSELEVVCSAISECFSKSKNYTNAQIVYNLDTDKLDVHYTDSKGAGMCIPLDQLSDGYKSTVSLIADIAYRMSILNPQFSKDILLKTEGVVLIDEIDLHLHPSWQQRIISDLTRIFPKIQFIVTTHAPAVINTVKSDSLIILENRTAREPAGEIYGKDANTVLRGIMGSYERPEDIKTLFDSFYSALSSNDFEKSEKIIENLEREIGENDSELVGCKVKLKLKQLKGGQK